MHYFLTVIVSAIGGFLLHAFSMKVNFKQRTIDNKIKVYDSIIGSWIKMRNFIFSRLIVEKNVWPEFDKIYGESQTFIGEAFLVSEDNELVEEINRLNEELYREKWDEMNFEERNNRIEGLKRKGIGLIIRMKQDIKNSTHFELEDFTQIFCKVGKK